MWLWRHRNDVMMTSYIPGPVKNLSTLWAINNPKTSKLPWQFLKHFGKFSIIMDFFQIKMTKQYEKWILCTNISRNRGIIHVSGPKIGKVMLTDGHFGSHFEFGHFLKMLKDMLSLPAMYAIWRPLGPQIHWEKNDISRCRVLPLGYLTIFSHSALPKLKIYIIWKKKRVCS